MGKKIQITKYKYMYRQTLNNDMNIVGDIRILSISSCMCMQIYIKMVINRKLTELRTPTSMSNYTCHNYMEQPAALSLAKEFLHCS